MTVRKLKALLGPDATKSERAKRHGKLHLLKVDWSEPGRYLIPAKEELNGFVFKLKQYLRSKPL